MKQVRTTIMTLFPILIMLLFVGCSAYISDHRESTTEVTQAWREETYQKDTEEETSEMTEQETQEETSEEFSAVPSQEESTEMPFEEELIEIRLLIDTIKQPLYTFSWGTESSQLGYWYEADNPAATPMGPTDFAVEDGVICVLDSVNHRVVMLEDGGVTEIDTSASSFDTEMIYQNQMIGVVDYMGDVVRIYQKDGTLAHHIDLPYAGIIGDLVEIGDTYVDWVVRMGNRYRYDWVQGSLENLGSWENQTVKVHAPVERSAVAVEGIDATGVYYYYTDIPNLQYVICREMDEYRWLTEVDLSGMRSFPYEPLYYSRDGSLYLMECLEEGVVISRLSIGQEN